MRTSPGLSGYPPSAWPCLEHSAEGFTALRYCGLTVFQTVSRRFWFNLTPGSKPKGHQDNGLGVGGPDWSWGMRVGWWWRGSLLWTTQAGFTCRGGRWPRRWGSRTGEGRADLRAESTDAITVTGPGGLHLGHCWGSGEEEDGGSEQAQSWPGTPSEPVTWEAGVRRPRRPNGAGCTPLVWSLLTARGQQS